MKVVEDMLGKLKGFNLERWLNGGSRRQYCEHLSYLLVFISVALLSVGMALGGFIKYAVYLASFGALLLLPAIILYIASQLMEVRHETVPVQKQ